MLSTRSAAATVLAYWNQLRARSTGLSLGLLGTLLAWGWLQPHRSTIWISFRSDAWIAGALSVAALVVFSRYRAPPRGSALLLLASLLALSPWLQVAMGMVPFVGLAWLMTLNLTGFVLAITLGQRWEAWASNQALDALFLGIGIAGLGSVGIQVYQWLPVYYPELSTWINSSNPLIPYGNLIQRNQMATFLLWGLVACAWGFQRAQVRASVALLLAAFLVFGLALTKSRTGYVGLAGASAALWLWRRPFAASCLPKAALGLLLYLVACVLFIDHLNEVMYTFTAPPLADQASSRFRLQAYQMFLEASMLKPMMGFGWTGIREAYLLVSGDHPGLDLIFSQTHNLFLDAVIWLGWPAALLISGCFIWWLHAVLRRIQTTEDALLVLMLGTFLWHAMLELPHHYLYFLLPVGVVLGVLDARHRRMRPLALSWWAPLGLLSMTLALAFAIGLEYTRVEAAYRRLQPDQVAGIRPTPQDAYAFLLMNQWTHVINAVTLVPFAGIPQEKLALMENAVKIHPSPQDLYVLVLSLALNQRTEEARLWALRASRVVDSSNYDVYQAMWRHARTKYPQLEENFWPKRIP